MPEPPWRASKATATEPSSRVRTSRPSTTGGRVSQSDVADADIDPVDDLPGRRRPRAGCRSLGDRTRAGLPGSGETVPEARRCPSHQRSGDQPDRAARPLIATPRRAAGVAPAPLPFPAAAGSSNARMPVAVGSSVTRTSIAPVRSAARIACTLVGPAATATTVSMARRSSRPIAMVRDSRPGIGRPDASMKRVLTFADGAGSGQRASNPRCSRGLPGAASPCRPSGRCRPGRAGWTARPPAPSRTIRSPVSAEPAASDPTIAGAWR